MINLMIGVMTLSVLSACGITTNMQNISEKMVGLNERIDIMTKNTTHMEDSIKSMSGGIHAQALSIALNEMLKPENTKYITLTQANPIPMIPAAKGLAEIVTEQELVGLTYIMLNEINNCQVDTMNLTKEQKDKFDLDKMVKLTALQLIATFAPEKTIDDMIKNQIDNGGIYVESAYAVLTLRSIFIKDVMLDQIMGSNTKMTSPAKFENALNFLEAVSNIVNRNYGSNLKIKIFGMYDTDGVGLNQTVESDVKPETIRNYYKTLSDKLDKDLDEKYKLNNTKLLASIKERINKGLNQ